MSTPIGGNSGPGETPLPLPLHFVPLPLDFERAQKFRAKEEKADELRSKSLKFEKSESNRVIRGHTFNEMAQAYDQLTQLVKEKQRIRLPDEKAPAIESDAESQEESTSIESDEESSILVEIESKDISVESMESEGAVVTLDEEVRQAEEKKSKLERKLDRLKTRESDIRTILDLTSELIRSAEGKLTIEQLSAYQTFIKMMRSYADKHAKNPAVWEKMEEDFSSEVTKAMFHESEKLQLKRYKTFYERCFDALRKDLRSTLSEAKSVRGKIESLDLELGEALATGAEEAEELPITPEMEKMYLAKFGPYVSKEAKRQASEKITNQLIAVGTSLGISKEKAAAVPAVHLKKLTHIQEYERKKNVAIPPFLTRAKKRESLTEVVPLEIPGMLSKQDYKVEMSQASSGNWVAVVKDLKTGDKVLHSSKDKGHVGYMQASAWVHAQLDSKFYEASGLKDDLSEIMKGLGITANTLNILSNMQDLIPRKLGGTLATQAGFVSSVTDPLKIAQQVGTVGDIVGLSLLIPSMLEALKANKVKEEASELDERIANKKNDLGHIEGTLEHVYRELTNDELFITHVTDLKDLQEKLQGMNQNKQVRQMLDLVKESLEIRKEISLLKKESKSLKLVVAEKYAGAATNSIAALGTGVKAGITLQHLVATGSAGVGGTASTGACLTLSLIAAPALIAAGVIQMGFDSNRVHKARRQKNELAEIADSLEKAVDVSGQPLLSTKEMKLIKDIQKMELRNINRKIASASLGITSDAFLIGVGGIAIASAVLGASTLGAGAIVLPIAAGAAVGAKLTYDASSKAYTDKKQKEYMKSDPDKSDIGKIARLHLLLQENNAAAKLVGEKLIEDYYDMEPEIFLEITKGIVVKYHELVKAHH